MIEAQSRLKKMVKRVVTKNSYEIFGCVKGKILMYEFENFCQEKI